MKNDILSKTAAKIEKIQLLHVKHVDLVVKIFPEETLFWYDFSICSENRGNWHFRADICQPAWLGDSTESCLGDSVSLDVP